MNMTKLKLAEANFLEKYPDGFNHPELAALRKKHKIAQMIALSQESFSESRFSKPQDIAGNMVKIIGRSSMVSMFEKPKFRDFVAALSESDLQQMTGGLKILLHGNQEQGFSELVEVLKQGKLAKWSLLTILPNYFRPNDEVFVKPTTAKGVIQHFELDRLEYKPTPTWDFYSRYRSQIIKMRKAVDKSIAPNNAAFCGFLMMSLEG